MRKRRFLKTRQTQWAHQLTKLLKEKGWKPNQISLLSLFFALLGSAALLLVPHVSHPAEKAILFASTALFIQLRLLCNLMDGMLAIEGKVPSKLGEIFNELPDRISDSMILICAGHMVTYGQGVLGWMAALFALATAYLRVLGTSLGTEAYFSGPMAKPHRMFTLTVGCILAIVFIPFHFDFHVITFSLICIVLGSIVTCVRRMRFISEEMMSK